MELDSQYSLIKSQHADGTLRESDWFDRAMQVQFPPFTMDWTIENRLHWLWNVETFVFPPRDFLHITERQKIVVALLHMDQSCRREWFAVHVTGKTPEGADIALSSWASFKERTISLLANSQFPDSQAYKERRPFASSAEARSRGRNSLKS
jgi:hypothetical protein